MRITCGRCCAGRKVLVARNGSREAASALRGAWPLEAADRVDLLMVDPSPEAEAFIDKHLKRHGVETRLHIYREADAGVGEMIRDHAEDFRSRRAAREHALPLQPHPTVGGHGRWREGRCQLPDGAIINAQFPPSS